MRGPPKRIDWQALARDLGTIRGPGEVGSEIGSTELACEAIERLLGPANVASAVDHYIALQPGFELARAILWHLHPWSAMLRCREIFASDADIQARRGAVELLRVVADRRALPWIPEMLADPDPEIQAWTIGILDQLISSGLIDEEECTPILEIARQHSNPHVQELAAEIRERIVKNM